MPSWRDVRRWRDVFLKAAPTSLFEDTFEGIFVGIDSCWERVSAAAKGRCQVQGDADPSDRCRLEAAAADCCRLRGNGEGERSEAEGTDAAGANADCADATLAEGADFEGVDSSEDGRQSCAFLHLEDRLCCSGLFGFMNAGLRPVSVRFLKR